VTHADICTEVLPPAHRRQQLHIAGRPIAPGTVVLAMNTPNPDDQGIWIADGRYKRGIRRQHEPQQEPLWGHENPPPAAY